MKMPPLRFHFYGIRLRILLVLVLIGVIYALPSFNILNSVDAFAILIALVTIAIFSIGFHTFNTTSKSYLSLRNHRKKFFWSAEIFADLVCLWGGLMMNGFFYLYYQESITTPLIITLIVFPFLFFTVVHSIGSGVALLLRNRFSQILALNVVILGVALFYKTLWENRTVLQQLLLLIPISIYPYDYPYAYTLLITIITVFSLLLAFINYLIFTKKR
ncbi:MAG: hypothetical protein PHY42_01200 [Bacilli bacterium]|nr:hypothetical protein [Bacilli bacterium]